MTGLAQQALQNTAVKLVDPEYGLFKDMIDEAVNSGLQGLPISLFDECAKCVIQVLMHVLTMHQKTNHSYENIQ